MEPTWIETDHMAASGKAGIGASCPNPGTQKLLHSSHNLPSPKGLPDYRSLTSEVPIPFKPSYPTPHSPISYRNCSFLRALLSMAAAAAPHTHIKGLGAGILTADVGLN